MVPLKASVNFLGFYKFMIFVSPVVQL